MLCAGVFAAALLFTSCGGSGGSGGSAKFKKFPKNEILGDLVNIVAEYYVKDSANTADFKATEEKIKEKYGTIQNGKGYDNYKEEYVQYTERKDQLKADMESAIEKEKANVIGKSVPFEMEDDLGYEVTECKIVDVNKHGGFQIAITVKLTDPEKASLTGFSKGNLYIHYQYIDKDGNIIQNSDENVGHGGNVELADKNAGTVGTIVSLEDIGWHSGKWAKNFGNFAKLRFEKTKK